MSTTRQQVENLKIYHRHCASGDPPAAPDRSGCHPDCGKTWRKYKNSGSAAMTLKGKWQPSSHDGRWEADDPVWCSPACRDARVPPLESKPAETGKLDVRPGQRWRGKVSGRIYTIAKVVGSEAHFIEGGRESLVCWGKDNPNFVLIDDAANAPPAQEAPKVPVPTCMWRHAQTACSGPLAIRYVGQGGKRESHGWCEGHYLEYERQAAACPESGKPYAGPERLPKPKLAHSHGVEDPALEDA